MLLHFFRLNKRLIFLLIGEEYLPLLIMSRFILYPKLGAMKLNAFILHIYYTLTL